MPILTYKCKNCGGDLKYSPEEKLYVCEYCDSRYTEEEMESGPIEDINEQQIEEGAVIYNCPNCGAEIVTDETTAATFCFYCHNPVILTGRLNGDYLPKTIVPFEIGREDAISRFLTWTKSKKYVPKDFFSKESIEKMTGVYFPYWLVDADVEVDVDAEAKVKDVQRIGSQERTTTKVYQVLRQGDIHLDDLSTNALKKADKELVEAVLPFDTTKKTEFKLPYLQGYQAEKRDLEQSDLQASMDSEVNQYIKNIVSDSIGTNYANVDYKRLDIEPKGQNWEYSLLPVWVMTYHRRNDKKLYYYALNGQTGKIAGELPVDNQKLTMHSVIVGLIVFAICLIGGFLL